MSKLPIYFSHGYREREAVFNKYFGILIENSGFIPSLDPPSGDVNSAKLEKHLKHTVGLIAIVANRDGNISPYIKYEIDIAIRVGKPVLVFIEDNIPDKVLPNFIFKRGFSTKSFFRDYYEHQNALAIFKTFIGEVQLPRVQSFLYQKSTIILGFENENMALEARIKNHLTSVGYFVWDKIEEGSEDLILEGEKHFNLSSTNLAICLTDKLSNKGSYYLGAIRSMQTPMILLTQKKKDNYSGWIPNEFRNKVLPKNENESFSIVNAQIDLYEEDFVVVDNERKWEKYINSLSTKSIIKGEYTNEFRDNIINNIHMGDKFENISGNVSKDNSGNLAQGRDVTIGSFIQEKFGKDAADALSKVAEIINQSKNQEARELFDSMNEELKKEKPKKSILSSLWTGVTTAIPLIKSSVDIFEKVSTMIQGLN
jgi:hypothetical protein